METICSLPARLFLILALGFSFVSTKSTAQTTNTQEDVNMTIDNKTTAENFDEITTMLKDYGVTATFSNIMRSESNELTGLKITLKTDNGQQTSSQISSSAPIGKISFGLKRGRLFIEQGNGSLSALAFGNSMGQDPFAFFGDSLSADHLQQLKFFSFKDFFGEESDNFNFSKDSMAIDKFRNKFYPFFKDPNAESEVFSWMNDPYDKSKTTYKFIDDPTKEKVIVIDGTVADFKTLDALAKANKIDKVDLLKPETAMSIYGASAKDGAIIATTKD